MPLARVAQPSPRQPAAAQLQERLDRALELSHAGQPVEAVRALREIRRRASSYQHPDVDRVVARTFLTEASAHLEITGDVDGALHLVAEAEEIARRIDASTLLATAVAQRALVVLRSGDTAAALDAFDAAAERLADMEPRDRAIVLLNRGVLWLEQGQLGRAEADLSSSAEHARRAGDARLESMARHNRGYVDFLAGNIPRALGAYEDAARAMPGELHPAMQVDHARALREAGLLADADDVLADVARRSKELGLFQDLGEADLLRAECALADDDHARARDLAGAARRRFVRRQNLRWQRRAEIVALRSELAAAARQPARALVRLSDRADALADACRLEGRSELAREALLLAAESRLAAGRDPGCDPPRLRRLDPLPTRLHVREVRALAARHAGDAARARAEVRRGLDELGAHQSTLGSLDLRTAMARNGAALARLGLALAVDTGSPAAVLAAVEHARAVSTRLPPVLPPSDGTTAALLGELRRVEEEAQSLEGDAGSAPASTRLRSRAAALRTRIRARAWELESDDRRVQHAPRLAHVRGAVRETGSVFVTFARHRGAWLAVVVRPSGARLVPLAPVEEVAELVRRVRADLDVLALDRMPEQMLPAVRGSLEASLIRLDEALLRPLGVTGDPVVASCSGPLTVLPWTLLPSRAGAPTVVTPAATTWLSAHERPGRPQTPHVVSLAGPGLHGSEHEARTVSATWPDGALLAGDGANTAAARSALGEADLLHVAAHGRHRAESPLFSSLRLADGPLYAYELDAGPGCVTLSACEAGLATLRPGDEGLGFTHALLHLGVRCVVAGVARVRDDVAAATMQRLHAAMAGGLGAAAALAEAQQEAAAEGVPAPFVCFGADW